MNTQHQMIKAHKRAKKLAKKLTLYQRMGNVQWAKEERQRLAKALGNLTAQNRAAEYLTVLGV